MRYLFVSDLHYALKQFDWVSSAATHVDLVIVGGDLLDISSTVDASVQITVMLRYLRHLAAKTRVIVCSGNHDLDARDADGEKVARWIRKADAFGVHTDRASLDVDGILFTVCPWWDGPCNRAAVAALLARDAVKPRRRWVWVYHSPPSDSPTSWIGKRHIGDAELNGWVEQYRPDKVLAGHIHQSPFVKDGSWVDRIGDTWVFNPGRQIGPQPTRILFDDEKAQALWVSQAGAEVVDMNMPLQRPVSEASEVPLWIR
jgi:Icc-related predicted phosphoesterase